MPFIAPQDRTKPVELKVNIRPEVVALLDEYATFLNSEKAYVVQEVLRKSIESDKDFQRARKSVAELPKAGKKAVA